MYCLKSGLPINSCTHSTGFWCQSSTISVCRAPLSLRMSPSISKSSQVHFGPDKRASIFWKRDLLLWNDVQPSFWNCDVQCFNMTLYSTRKILLTFFSCRSSFMDACIVPDLSIHCPNSQSFSSEKDPHTDSPLVTWVLHKDSNMVGSLCWNWACMAHYLATFSTVY